MKMLSLRVGTNDLAKARAFYDATFGVLGVSPEPAPADRPILMYAIPGGPRFLVGPARDGQPATHANGGTILFAADSDEQVSAWYEAGMANGGTCEGKPEPKPQTGGKFGAYLRDPDGNKLAVYHGLNIG
jgi:catechol 2,3-dioxygenase-like lactoylglutathione lyase family enzyme